VNDEKTVARFARAATSLIQIVPAGSLTASLSLCGSVYGPGAIFFLIDVEADILCPIHVSVEHVVVFFTHVQATLNTLSLVFLTAYTTRPSVFS
jgi:hypothetical protein